MKIIMDHHNQMTEIWITNSEKNDPAVQNHIDSICKQNKQNKVATIIYQSGFQDLYSSVRDLLIHNRLQSAKNESMYGQAHSCNTCQH